MDFTRYIKVFSTLIPVTILIGCSPTGNPQLDMCQKITSNLLIGNPEFGEIQETKGRERMQMVLPYVSDGESGEATCTFAVDHNQDGVFQTSPMAMNLDGIEIGKKDLVRASLASSKVVLKDTAKETQRQTAEAAEEAKVIAKQAADEAKVIAAEAKETATELAADAKVKAGEIADQAGNVMEQTKEKGREIMLDGAQKLQEKLEQ